MVRAASFHHIFSNKSNRESVLVSPHSPLLHHILLSFWKKSKPVTHWVEVEALVFSSGTGCTPTAAFADYSFYTNTRLQGLQKWWDLLLLKHSVVKCKWQTDIRCLPPSIVHPETPLWDAVLFNGVLNISTGQPKRSGSLELQYMITSTNNMHCNEALSDSLNCYKSVLWFHIQTFNLRAVRTCTLNNIVSHNITAGLW